MIVKETICLNCGTICNGSYCPNCGQSTQTPARITMRTFGKSFMMSFSGTTSDFWETFVGLILHPWIVIKEYIHGKWTKYSSPIAMLMQLLIVFTVIYSILGDMAEIHDLKYRLDSTYLYAYLLDRKSRIKVKVIYAENQSDLRGESPVKKRGTSIFSF